jgi:hypothetical protein
MDGEGVACGGGWNVGTRRIHNLVALYTMRAMSTTALELLLKPLYLTYIFCGALTPRMDKALLKTCRVAFNRATRAQVKAVSVSTKKRSAA